MEINSVLNKDTKEKGKGFFILNLYLINLIVKLGAGFEEVSAYVVLVRGAGRRREISTHGASSIAARTGMTYTRAEKSLKWLQDHKIISKAEDGCDEKSRKRLPRYPIGIFRLRFRAHTQDTGKGLAAEKHRVDRWTSILEQL